MISGQYVKTFAEASHALPDGLSLDSDYPLKLPKIEKIEDGKVFLRSDIYYDDEHEYSGKIVKGKNGEYFKIAQSSSFERLMRKKPTVFTFLPFKDKNTEAVGSPQLALLPKS